MINKASYESFSGFINPELDPNRVYVIPDYQREYAWDMRQCEQLLDDLDENEEGYFLGSIIWVNKSRDIIDGQQRLTTISLLLIALYEKMKEQKASFNEEQAAEFLMLKRLIVTADGTPRLKLQDQNKNERDYTYLIRSIVHPGPVASTPEPNHGNRRLTRNYRRFKDGLATYGVDQLFSLFEKVRRLTFVTIEVVDTQSAYLLFEAMNDRGMPLSPIDLIKSKYMSQKKDYSGWKELIEILGDDYSSQEQFMRNNYNAFRAEYNHIVFSESERVKYGLGIKATKSNIIGIYEKLISNEADFMEVLLARARIYSLMLGRTAIPEYSEIFKDFRNARATSAFMLLLYLYSYKDAYEIKDSDMIEMFRFILKFFVRRNLTNTPSTGSIPQILMDIIEKINRLSQKTFKSINEIVVQELTCKSSSDTVLKEVLEGDIYLTSAEMTRYLLCSFAKADETASKEATLDLWDTDKAGKYIWTIEHIFPETENIPDSWIRMITGLSDDQEIDAAHVETAKRIRQNFVHKIGNLTMTGYNSDLGKMSFQKKKDRKREENGKELSIGYNNGLSLNAYVLAQSVWTEKEIRTRTKDLVEKAMAMLYLQSCVSAEGYERKE